MSSMTSKASSGWGGDLYQVYGGPDDASLLCWASVWDSKKDRDEFLLAVEDVVQHHCPRLESWEAVGTEAALLIFADKAGKDTAPILREACRLTALKP